MAEIASAYPTAGGLYYWASKMKNKNWGWWTAWLNLIGQFAIVAGINYAAAGFLNATIIDAALRRHVQHRHDLVLGLTQRPARDDGRAHAHPAGAEHRRDQPRGAAQPGQRLVAHRHRRCRRRPHLPRRQAGPVRADACSRSSRRTWAAAGTTTSASSTSIRAGHRRYPVILAFFFSLLLANWTYTGYDASAHVAEETVGARMSSAWGVFLSVAVSAVVGFIFLFALTTHLPRLTSCSRRPVEAPPQATASQYYFGGGVAVIAILEYNLGSSILGGRARRRGSRSRCAFCGLASVAAAGRMLFAFSRDDGIPGSGWLKRVSPPLPHAGECADRDRRSSPGCSRSPPCIVGGGDRDRDRHRDQHDLPVRGVRHRHLPGRNDRGVAQPPRLEPRPLVEAGGLAGRLLGASC